jgi:hypothetical protein
MSGDLELFLIFVFVGSPAGRCVSTNVGRRAPDGSRKGGVKVLASIPR